MITSHLPSKFVRNSGLLVASALLAFSTSAVTAATLPYANELLQLNAALKTLDGAGVTVANATESQLQAALALSGSATKPAQKTPVSDLNASLFAQAIQSQNNPNMTPLSTVTDVAAEAKIVTPKGADVPVANIAAIVNIFLPSATTDAAALALVNQGLKDNIFTSGVTKALTPEILRLDYIKALWTAKTVFAWDGSADALAQITNSVVLADTLSVTSKETVVADVLGYAPTDIKNVLEVVTSSTATLGTDVTKFATGLVTLLPADAGAIAIGVSFENPSLALSGSLGLVTQLVEATAGKAIADVPLISASMGSITATFDSADGIANSVVTGYREAGKIASLTTPVATTMALALAGDIVAGGGATISSGTLSGVTLDSAKAEEIAAVVYTFGSNISKFSSANFVSLVDGLLAAKGARLATSTSSADDSQFYVTLAGDLAATAKSLGLTLSAAQLTTIDGSLNAAIKASGDANAGSVKIAGSDEALVLAALNGTATPVVPFVSGSADQTTSMTIK